MTPFSIVDPRDTEGFGARQIDERAGTLHVRLAETEAEIDAALALRYRVFYEEMSARPTEEVARLKRDFDDFDAHCDHLIVLDNDLGPGPESVCRHLSHDAPGRRGPGRALLLRGGIRYRPAGGRTGRDSGNGPLVHRCRAPDAQRHAGAVARRDGLCSFERHCLPVRLRQPARHGSPGRCAAAGLSAPQPSGAGTLPAGGGKRSLRRYGPPAGGPDRPGKRRFAICRR